MKTNETKSPDPWHLEVLRGLVWAVAVFLLVSPRATDSGVVAALLAIPTALVAARMLCNTSLRLPWLAAMGGGIALLGAGLGTFVVSSPALTKLFGMGFAVFIEQTSTYGPLTFALVFILRLLAKRMPGGALVETAAVGSAVAMCFISHQDMQLDRPRALCDWALSHGVSPLNVLIAIGVGAWLALAMLLIRGLGRIRTLGAIAFLICASLLAFTFVEPSVKTAFNDFDRTGADGQESNDANNNNNQNQDGGKGNDHNDHHGQDDDHPKGDPVAVVIFHDKIESNDSMYYFRQGAWSEYNGTRMVDSLDHFDSDLFDADQSKPQSVKLPNAMQDKFATVRTTVHVIKDGGGSITLVNGEELGKKTEEHTALYQAKYTVKSRVLMGDLLEDDKSPLQQVSSHSSGHLAGVGSEDWNENTWAHYLAAPKDARYAAVLKEIEQAIPAGSKDNSLARCKATRDWVAEHIIYNLKCKQGREGQIIEGVLFGDRRGFCLHISHITAVLLRMQGVPARVAHGFAVPVSNRGNGTGVMLTTNHLHAWCEIYIEGCGWTIMDPSPKHSETGGLDQPPIELQKMAIEQAHEDELKPEEPQKPNSLSWKLCGLLLLAGLLCACYVRKVVHRLLPALTGPGNLYRACYRAALERLAELGLVRKFGETREEFGRRVAQQIPEFGWLTEGHLRRALSERESFAPEQWQQCYTAFGQRVKGAIPAWRRILAVADPLSYLWAR